MSDGEKWDRALRKLIALTRDGSLIWNPNSVPRDSRDEVQGEGIYATVLQERHLIVYEYRFRNYTDEDTWTWDTEVAVEFVDGEGNLQWPWPALPGRFQLLDAIRYQAAGAGEFLEEFLSDTPSAKEA